ncbi:MAG: globin [Planctomycetota bacterium]
MAELPVDPILKLYDAVGEDGIASVVWRFYNRVRQDDILSPMYPDDDWDGAERRLKLFLIQRFGGPSTYSQERGHPRLRMRHMPFPIDDSAAARWLNLMRSAITEAAEAGDVPVDLATATMPFFKQVALFMVNR